MAQLEMNSNGKPKFDLIRFLKEAELVSSDGDFLYSTITKNMGISGRLMERIATGAENPTQGRAIEAVASYFQLDINQLAAFFAYRNSKNEEWQRHFDETGDENWLPVGVEAIEENGVVRWEYHNSWAGEFIEDFLDIPRYEVSEELLRKRMMYYIDLVWGAYFPDNVYYADNVEDNRDNRVDAYNMIIMDVYRHMAQKRENIYGYDIRRMLNFLLPELDNRVNSLTFLNPPTEVPEETQEVREETQEQDEHHGFGGQ